MAHAQRDGLGQNLGRVAFLNRGNPLAAHLLGLALSARDLGRIPESRAWFRASIISDPADAEIIYQFGSWLFQIGSLEDSRPLITKTAILAANRFDAHALLGLLGVSKPDPRAATRSMRRALVLEPGVGDICFNLGQHLSRIGPNQGATSAFRMATVIQPNNPATWLELGAISYTFRNLVTAERVIRKSVRLDPTNSTAWSYLGLIRAATQHLDEASLCFKTALVLDPCHSDATVNLANMYRQLELSGKARRLAVSGPFHSPMSSRCWSTRSAISYDEAEHETSREDARKACIIDPANADGYGNFAQVAFVNGDTNAALQFGIRAFQLAPMRAEIQFNLGIFQLGAGQLGIGWRNYSARKSVFRASAPIGLPSNRWTDTSTQYQALLVVSEQGLGDEIQLASCLPDLATRFGCGVPTKILVECDRRLVPIYQRSFPKLNFLERLVDRNESNRTSDYTRIVESNQIDAFIELGDLPGFFRKSIQDFGIHKAYLTADEERSRAWRERFRTRETKPLIGLCWRSRKDQQSRRIYYPPILSLAPLFALDGVKFVSLQYDAPENDIQEIMENFGVSVFHPAETDLMNEIDDLAALINVMDHIVTANTSVFHLAGALGRPTHVMDYGYGWYTMGADHFPWYPSAQYRTKMPNEEWTPLVTSIASEIETRIRKF